MHRHVTCRAVCAMAVPQEGLHCVGLRPSMARTALCQCTPIAGPPVIVKGPGVPNSTPAKRIKRKIVWWRTKFLLCKTKPKLEKNCAFCIISLSLFYYFLCMPHTFHEQILHPWSNICMQKLNGKSCFFKHWTIKYFYLSEKRKEQRYEKFFFG